jgi:hypothetical protein
MDFLRLYLGEMMGFGLVLLTLFVVPAIAMRYLPNRRTAIRVVRNICIAATVAGFAISLIPSLAVNQPPRGRIDRTAVDQDQKAFELRHLN